MSYQAARLFRKVRVNDRNYMGQILAVLLHKFLKFTSNSISRLNNSSFLVIQEAAVVLSAVLRQHGIRLTWRYYLVLLELKLESGSKNRAT